MKRLLLTVFTILVISGMASAASLTREWDAPTTNTDGTPISGFVGNYKLYRGVSTGVYTVITPVVNPAATVSYVINGLLDDTNYCWVVTALNTYGNESAYSNEICQRTAKAIPTKPTLR